MCTGPAAVDGHLLLGRRLLDAALAVIALPLLRPLRLLRLVAVIGVLNRRAGSSLRGRVVVYVVGATTLLTAVAALAMLDAERNAPGANITTVGDALWWGITTITTVGYGDRSPRPPRDASSRSDSCSPASLCSVSLPPPWPSWIIDESAKNRGRAGGHLGAGRSADLRGPPSQGAAAARPEDSTGYGRRRLARTVSLEGLVYRLYCWAAASPASCAGGDLFQGRLRSSRPTPRGKRGGSLVLGLPVKIAWLPPAPSVQSNRCRDPARPAGQRQVVSGHGGRHLGGGRHRRPSPCGCRRR